MILQHLITMSPEQSSLRRKTDIITSLGDWVHSMVLAFFPNMCIYGSIGDMCEVFPELSEGSLGRKVRGAGWPHLIRKWHFRMCGVSGVGCSEKHWHCRAWLYEMRASFLIRVVLSQSGLATINKIKCRYFCCLWFTAALVLADRQQICSVSCVHIAFLIQYTVREFWLSRQVLHSLWINCRKAILAGSCICSLVEAAKFLHLEEG